MSESPQQPSLLPSAKQDMVGAAVDAFDCRRAWSLAAACAAAYRGSTAEIVEQGFASAELFGANAACGYIAQCEQDVVLSFRGTDAPTDEGNRCLSQWLVNCDFAQIDGYGGRVHKGFAQAVDLLWDQVHGQVRAALTPGCKLWVTGHSLGGALATLAAARLARESIPVAGVYTFGSPRVGDAAFAATYRPTLYCVENGNDIVCHLPPPPAAMEAVRPMLERLAASKLQWSIPADVVYADIGKLTFIDWEGKVRANVSEGERATLAAARLFRFVRMIFMSQERASLLEDHRITSYLERLARAVHPAVACRITAER